MPWTRIGRPDLPGRKTMPIHLQKIVQRTVAARADAALAAAVRAAFDGWRSSVALRQRVVFRYQFYAFMLVVDVFRCFRHHPRIRHLYALDV